MWAWVYRIVNPLINNFYRFIQLTHLIFDVYIIGRLQEAEASFLFLKTRTDLMATCPILKIIKRRLRWNLPRKLLIMVMINSKRINRLVINQLMMPIISKSLPGCSFKYISINLFKPSLIPFVIVDSHLSYTPAVIIRTALINFE